MTKDDSAPGGAVVVVPPDLLAEMDEVAKVGGCTREDLTREAISAHLDHRRALAELLDERCAEADRGELTSHETVFAELRQRIEGQRIEDCIDPARP